MNTEFAINNALEILENNMTTNLTALQMESSSSIVTPDIEEYKFGEYNHTLFTKFPSICVWSPYSRKSIDKTGFQIRRISLKTLVWSVANDLSDLHRFVARYSNAIERILRDESNWSPKLHNSLVEDSNLTDLYQVNVGYGQGCQVDSTIDYLLI
jgi:hypothetical protein